MASNNHAAKNLKFITFLLTSAYFVSYFTRLSYNTILVEMIDALEMSKAEASLPLIGMSIAYGTGQLVSGFFGDRFRPKYLVAVGFVTTVIMNLLITVCTTALQITVVWTINGFAQSFMWPPIVKLMSDLYDMDGYNKVCVAVSNGGSLGNIMLYIAAPLMLGFWGYKSVFYICAAVGTIMLLVWLWKCPSAHIADKKKRDEENEKKASFPWSFMFIGILFAIILMGMLRDGITAWTPSLISENFRLGNEISILTGVLLPLFGMIAIMVASEIRNRFVRNELAFSAILFSVAVVCSIILVVFKGMNPVVYVIVLGLLVSAAHGVNLMLISFVPKYYAKYGVVSFAAGLVNSCTYVGAAISTYGIAIFSDSFGWAATVMLWGGIALTGAVLCVLLIKSWRQFSAQ